MIIANNNEEKRTELWHVVISVTTALIVLITAFFIIKLFTSNPLEGTWSQQNGDLTITLKGNGKMLIQWDMISEDENVQVGMDYVLDKTKKTITFKSNEKAMKEAVTASKGLLTIEMLKTTLKSLETTYNYSIDGESLTLMEREYGEQKIFDRQ